MNKDGSMLIKAKIGEMEVSMKGNYTIKGDTLTMTLTTPDGVETGVETIKELTDAKLITVGKSGTTTEFKKAKPEKKNGTKKE
jgi:uncharacterized protein (TIGR03066 family)